MVLAPVLMMVSLATIFLFAHILKSIITTVERQITHGDTEREKKGASDSIQI